MIPEISHLPAVLNTELDVFVQKTKQFSSTNLISLYLFGGLAKEEFETNNSDVNVLIILREATPASLDALNQSLQDPLYKIVLAPFIITADELENAANLFPVKFLDIKLNHVLLHGADLLQGIEIDHDLLRRNTRRELKNILFRLNQLYILHYAYPEILGDKMKHLLPSLLIHINIINYLKVNKLYKSKEEIIEHAAQESVLDTDLLKQLYNFKKGGLSIHNRDIISWYGNFMALVKEISMKADAL